MALFSDIDWLVILGLGAFLLLGPNSGPTVRQFGRWYGRVVRLKQELLSEVAKAADLPLSAGANPASLRAALLGVDVVGAARPGIPAAVRVAPTAPAPAEPAFPIPLPSTGGYPVASWSATYFDNVPRGLP